MSSRQISEGAGNSSSLGNNLDLDGMIISFADLNQTVSKMVELKDCIEKALQPKKTLAKSLAIKLIKENGNNAPADNEKYFNFFGLPTELILEIFKLLGPMPKGPKYIIDNLEDVHPCYAICSTSKYLQDFYIAAMGDDIPEDIEIVLRPADYNVPNSSANSRILLEERLGLLGRMGLEVVTSIRIIGPKLKRESTRHRVTKFLREERVPRLDPEDKALIKTHVEEDIRGKQKALEGLFRNLKDLFGRERILKLSIYAGELPATAWHRGLASFVQSQSNLTSFAFIDIPPEERSTRYRARDNVWPYIQRLSRQYWFDTREEQPSNYPETHNRHRRNYESLSKALCDFVEGRRLLGRHRIDDTA